MLTAYAQLASSMALVGANVGVAKALSDALPISMIAGLRCLIAVAVLAPLALWRDPPAARVPSRAVLANLFWQAALGTVLYNAALLAGLRLTGALEGGMVLASLPAVVALGAWLWLREPMRARAWASAALAALGIGAVVLARGPGGAAGQGGGSGLGVALVLAAVCGEAAYALLAKRVAGRVPPLTASLWMQGFSAALLLPLWLPDAGAAAALSDPRLAGLLAFHALTSSVLCLLLWYAGLARAPASVAGVFTAFLPASAAATAVLFLGESFTAGHAVAFALVLASVLLATWPSRARAA